MHYVKKNDSPNKVRVARNRCEYLGRPFGVRQTVSMHLFRFGGESEEVYSAARAKGRREKGRREKGERRREKGER
jgi:hypothetical protein